MNFKNRKYFTLVELIIVIAIIGVLSVSAFTIVTKWLGKSRDSRRLGEINQISKGLQSYQIENGKYPMPDMNYITLTSGTNTIGYQGYVGSGVSRIIELNKITKDPMDDKYYTYTTNLSKYQLMAMLEGSGVVQTSYVNRVYAVDYSKRYPYLVGDKLGVILANTGGNTNAPVQELYNSTTFTGINIPSIDTGSYTSYVDNTTILNGTGLLQIPIYTNQSVVTPTTQESGGGSSPTNSCANTAWVSNATYLTGTPTTTNQAWQNTNSSNPCYFSCNGGYSWDGSVCTQYEISNSLRFNGNNNYLSRYFNTSGNRKIWTFSAWVKRSKLGTDQTIFGVSGPDGRYGTEIRFGNDTAGGQDLNSLYFHDFTTTNQFSLVTNSVYRDTSSWMHIVITLNTVATNAVDRAIIYVNGQKITNFYGTPTYPAQNYEGRINTANYHFIGKLGEFINGSDFYFNGYITDINFIDGQSLESNSFGMFDVNGNWIPKAYTGTYGTNGFNIGNPFNSNIVGTNIGHYLYGGSSASSSNYGVVVAQNAFGGSTNEYGYWSTPILGTDWIMRDFGTPKTPAKMRVIGYGAYFSPTTLVQYSDNNSTWTTAYTLICENQDNTDKTFYINAGSHRYWRLLRGSNPFIGAGGPWALMEWEIYEADDTLGIDRSGNGNNFIPYFFNTYDQMIDTPTNNFATWNYYSTIKNGNLQILTTSSLGGNVNATLTGNSSFYYEVTLNSFTNINSIIVGMRDASNGNFYGYAAGDGTYGGMKYSNSNGWQSYSSAINQNNVIGVIYDSVSGNISFTKDGSTQGIAYSSLIGKNMVPSIQQNNINGWLTTVNFGQGGQSGLQWCSGAGGYFKYCPPAGYKALSSKNFPN